MNVNAYTYHIALFIMYKYILVELGVNEWLVEYLEKYEWHPCFSPLVTNIDEVFSFWKSLLGNGYVSMESC